MGTSSTVLLEVVTPGSQGSGDGAGGATLRAQLYMPSASAVENAEVTVTKRALGGGPAPSFTHQVWQCTCTARPLCTSDMLRFQHHS
jgi:hypothetical protein